MSERTTSASWASGIVKALELEGLDCQAMFKQLGLDFAALDDPDARFPQDAMTRLWQLAVELSGNEAIGLNMARVVRPASFHVVGYALMSSRTLAEGFERLVRYQRIIAESADLSFRLEPEGYALVLTVHGDHLPPTRHSAEASLACALSLCTWLSGRAIQPRRVLIQGPQPKNVEPYKTAFHALWCSVRPMMRWCSSGRTWRPRCRRPTRPWPCCTTDSRGVPGTLLGKPGDPSGAPGVVSRPAPG